MTVTRSLGILPGFPYMGPLPGGGYSGATTELDALVVAAAEALTAEYGRDVVIRFNSDRMSGGAWLRDEPTHDVLVGLTARLPKRLAVTTYVVAKALIDPSLVTRGLHPDGDPYAYVEHRSLDAALVWLRENVRLPARMSEGGER